MSQSKSLDNGSVVVITVQQNVIMVYQIVIMAQLKISRIKNKIQRPSFLNRYNDSQTAIADQVENSFFICFKRSI
jgi:hypothetical protein